MEKFQEFYLVESNERGEESALMQNFANGFMRGGDANTAYKFKDEEKVKQVCKMQNTIAEILNNGTKTHYVKQDITRTKYDENGEEIKNNKEVS